MTCCTNTSSACRAGDSLDASRPNAVCVESDMKVGDGERELQKVGSLSKRETNTRNDFRGLSGRRRRRLP